ncbi:MAG: class I SAM-dependent methyltransferase [Acidobacteriota bacterium]
MTDPLARFSNRTENYVKYRPGYPSEILKILKSDCGLQETSVVADVGSGTGILCEMLLKNGNTVFAVEPNAAMRLTAEDLRKKYGKFNSIDAAAEASTLATASVDFVTAAQAFHWFDRQKAKAEFARILKPGGWVVLIWNERRLDSTPFLRAYEELLLRYGTDYQQVRHENVTDEIEEFFAPETFELKTLQNVQHFDFNSLKGRLLSSSYAPNQDRPNFNPMLSELGKIFNANQRAGIVNFEYKTKVYYGRLAEVGT